MRVRPQRALVPAVAPAMPAWVPDGNWRVSGLGGGPEDTVCWSFLAVLPSRLDTGVAPGWGVGTRPAGTLLSVAASLTLSESNLMLVTFSVRQHGSGSTSGPRVPLCCVLTVAKDPVVQAFRLCCLLIFL